MSENLTYEELIKRNRAEKQARDMALRKSLLIKLAIRATIAVVCSGIAFVAWKRYEAKKQREAELVAIEIRRQEEVAQKEREKRRIEEEAAAKQREQERIEQLRKIDEERVARERKREEERMAWERKCEEERMARELEMAEKLRKKEEERLRLEKERIALSRRIEEERQEREKATAHNQVQRQTANANTQNGLASRPTKKNASDEQYNLAFFNIRSRMGGSILEPLVKRLNDIEDDRMKHAVSRTARMVAMSAIAGRIGPVNYHRMIKTKTVTSTQNIGTFYGQTQGGSLISGDVYGPVSRTRTKVGGYVCEVPNGFKSAFDQMSSLGRKGHARANAEVASCIFVDAAKGMIGMDERKSLQLFEGAANAGDAEAMFMQAFCLFYGIGTQSNNSNTANAYRVLLGWEQHADSESLRNSGWAKRRLSEAHKCFRE